MERKNIVRYINLVAAVMGLIIACAVVWELIFPSSRLAKIIGFIAFGALCIFVRAVPPKFWIQTTKK